VKLAPLTLLCVCAAPARADVAVELPPTWRDRCAGAIDAAAQKMGLPAGARRDVLPLLREDGTPNPVHYVEYAAADGIHVLTGNDSERRADKSWTLTLQEGGKPARFWFRRAHGYYAKLTLSGPWSEKAMKAALDECLKMGESK
jgi:acyl-CoA reductase-like NAD-dependent aldehyde dehydrogenase